MRNEEGDIVFLNRVTGEVALKKPADDKKEDTHFGETWKWIYDTEEAWLPAKFISKKANGKYEFSSLTNEIFEISEKLWTTSIPLNPATLNNYVHDLLMLDEINEANILFNIRNRYDKKRIYTRLGKILITVNPYKLYPLYTIDVIDKYKEAITVGSLPPHVYEIAKSALTELNNDRKA